jgi:hypothetical protein
MAGTGRLEAATTHTCVRVHCEVQPVDLALGAVGQSDADHEGMGLPSWRMCKAATMRAC